MKQKKYIWLFGENDGKTSNNNSFYFWDHVVLNEDNIEKYFILERNNENCEKVKKMEKNKRKYVVWKNSIKHYYLYKDADMFWVSLSYKDISPSNVLGKEIVPKVLKPVIYLQHGTIAMKRLGYSGKSYNNNMFRFMIYNRRILEQYQNENNFKPYQLYYAEYHPRYKELVKRMEQQQNIKKEEKQILWFLTWREYLGDNAATKKIINNIKYIVNNKNFNDFLSKKNYKLKICAHQFFNKEIIKEIVQNQKTNIKILYPKDVNIMDELIKSDLLITDYSSIGFDFTFLNKPVILYQPDLDIYMKERSFYCNEKEIEKYSIKTSKKLVDTIMQENYEINQFFKDRLPENIDYQYVKQGKHIDKIYQKLKEIQNNKITFIGYNFYGVGGTVSATKALSEALLEKGYMVELLSLKKTKSGKPLFPYGLNVKSLYIAGSRKKKELLKRLFRTSIWYGYLKYDKNKENLIPYVGYALKRKLNKIKSNTVISTRESLHFFLKNAKSKNIKNKLYFFHTDAKVLQETFPKVLENLKKGIILENAIFVTQNNKEDYKNIFNYEGYEKSLVLGNTLESERMTNNIEDITNLPKRKGYIGIILTRISVDRKEDIERIIEFGTYLKKQKKKNITIEVYGKGDYLEEFEEMIKEKNIGSYILYKGVVNNPREKIVESDFVLDLSKNQSFGMIYLEAILNGRMVFCTKNIGSLETLKEIPECYYENYDELIRKIENVKSITKEKLEQNYKIISNKYSRENLANKFLTLIQ